MYLNTLKKHNSLNFIFIFRENKGQKDGRKNSLQLGYYQEKMQDWTGKKNPVLTSEYWYCYWIHVRRFVWLRSTHQYIFAHASSFLLRCLFRRWRQKLWIEEPHFSRSNDFEKPILAEIKLISHWFLYINCKITWTMCSTVHTRFLNLLFFFLSTYEKFTLYNNWILFQSNTSQISRDLIQVVS